MTVDAELSEALAAVEIRPLSKSRLIRNLALRSALLYEDRHFGVLGLESGRISGGAGPGKVA